MTTTGSTITPERLEAKRLIQDALGGRFDVLTVAHACQDMLVETIGVLSNTPEDAERVMPEIAAEILRDIRLNWPEIQAAQRLYSEPHVGEKQ